MKIWIIKFKFLSSLEIDLVLLVQIYLHEFTKTRPN